MLGGQEKFDTVPFFWSQHYDVPITYVGHAETWDKMAVEGDIAARDCVLRYERNGRVLAVASIYRATPRQPYGRSGDGARDGLEARQSHRGSMVACLNHSTPR
jgi:hypothetical protein